MAVISVNTDAIKQHVLTLGKIHRSAIPSAIRGTLNRAAMDVKTVTMPSEADIFIHRKPTFFKANSRAEFAKGFDVNTMKSTVGFTENNGSQQQAVEDMKQQDEGGAIGGRSLIPLSTARQSNSYTKMVKDRNRISAIKGNFIDAKQESGKNNAERFIKAAAKAGRGGYVVMPWVNKKGVRMLARITQLKKMAPSTSFGKKSEGGTSVSYEDIYSYKENRKVHPKATHFMRKASLETADKMEGFYIEEAEKQVKRLEKNG